jgi:hypothetical protein
MDTIPEAVVNQIEVVRRELSELAAGRWDMSESKSGSQALRSIAKRLVLSVKHLEELTKENTYSS